ncbi:MAG: class I SAM-dependent methyltransferase [Planctomycetota bacterium]
MAEDSTQPPAPERALPEASPIDDMTWTAVAALWARAVEQTAEKPLLKDPTATAWLDTLRRDTRRFEQAAATRVAVCDRARLIDRWVTEWANEPTNSRGVVVELGVGFSTRCVRLSSLNLDFVGIDRDNTLQQRAKLSAADSISTQAADITADDWISELHKTVGSREHCFVAEGLLMYLPVAEVERLFARLAAAFPHATILFDAYARPALWLQRFHDSLRHLDASLCSTFVRSPHLKILESQTLRDSPIAYARMPRVYRLPGVNRLHATHRATLIPPGSTR